MEDLGLDPETTLKLIQMLLRGAAYFFAGFALVGFSVYIVFLCLEIFSPHPRANATIAKAPQPIGCVSATEQTCDLVPAEAPTLAKGATVTREVLCEGSNRVDFPGVSAHQLLDTDTRNV